MGAIIAAGAAHRAVALLSTPPPPPEPSGDSGRLLTDEHESGLEAALDILVALFMRPTPPGPLLAPLRPALERALAPLSRHTSPEVRESVSMLTRMLPFIPR
jgi:hypothetical protein